MQMGGRCGRPSLQELTGREGAPVQRVPQRAHVAVLKHQAHLVTRG